MLRISGYDRRGLYLTTDRRSIQHGDSHSLLSFYCDLQGRVVLAGPSVSESAVVALESG